MTERELNESDIQPYVTAMAKDVADILNKYIKDMESRNFDKGDIAIILLNTLTNLSGNTLKSITNTLVDTHYMMNCYLKGLNDWMLHCHTTEFTKQIAQLCSDMADQPKH